MNIFDEIPAKRPMPEDAERRARARIKEGIRTGEEKTAHGRPHARWRFTTAAAAAAAAAIAAGFLIMQPWPGVGGPPLSAPGPSSPTPPPSLLRALAAAAVEPSRCPGRTDHAGRIDNPDWRGVTVAGCRVSGGAEHGALDSPGRIRHR